MTETAKAPKRDLKFVHSLDHQYVQCRSMRHAWTLLYFGYVREAPEEVRTHFSGGTIVRQSECLRCGCIKEDFYNTKNPLFPNEGEEPRFRAFYSRYRHPQGYLWKSANGVARPTFYDFTKELYDRFRQDTRKG